jgi:hypothetical protein
MGAEELSTMDIVHCYTYDAINKFNYWNPSYNIIAVRKIEFSFNKLILKD